eukprot:TRINITY_DN454_c0_g1_i5.p1 TRINITY_DN454_c0_g1~~TRINITY_DN454_c0_g1_i5.p1  ORF type:complete len:450 (-),score=70.47 TRINITY_DN454_c0_g1_i5:121-1470(-)
MKSILAILQNKLKMSENSQHQKSGDRQVSAVVIGCGNRGENYSNFGRDFPDRLKIIAVADPKIHRRNKIGDFHGIAEENRFASWESFKDKEKMADFAMICTQDKDHMVPAILMADKGYHILLEKPMAVSEEDCKKITEACQRNSVMLVVCHVLRYFPPAAKIKEIIDSGMIGEVMTINHTENIGYWHFAHSFVRGNWRNEAESTFSLLAKCCHDVDLIYFWMGGKEAVNIQSVGSLQHFKKDKKPAGASNRCLDCPLTKTCPYSAEKIYLSPPVEKHWPMSVVCDIEDDPTKYPGALRKCLETGPYGRCVYDCDNDVCDTQMVNFMFDTGAVANLTMTAFSADICVRNTRITGTAGELVWDGSSEGPIRVYSFSKDTWENVYPDSIAPKCRTNGHGGADFFLVDSFLKAIARNDPSLIKSGGQESLKSHLLVFEAEKSRKQNMANLAKN